MRDQWSRASAAIELSPTELTELVQPAFPGRRVIHSEPARGGLANTNLRIAILDVERPALVRLYTRDPSAGAREHAIHQRIADRVPVARFLHFAESNPITGHPYGVLEWVDGARLETVVLAQPASVLAEIGAAVGGTLARIHSFPFPRTGFLDRALDIATPISLGGDGLPWFLRQCLVEGRGAGRVEPAIIEATIELANKEAPRLDSWQGPPCLSHSDFGASNILVRPADGSTWTVAAVLDWEFAFSGSPFFDLGNLLRPPLGTIERFAESVADGYRMAGGYLPEDWRLLSLLVDLTAWAEFMNRPQVNAALIQDASAAMRRTLAAFGAARD